MRRSLLIHGPGGCGKTHHADALRKFFGLNRVIDGWREGEKLPPRGALILTNQAPKAPVDANILSFHEAAARARLPLRTGSDNP